MPSWSEADEYYIGLFYENSIDEKLPIMEDKNMIDWYIHVFFVLIASCQFSKATLDCLNPPVTLELDSCLSDLRMIQQLYTHICWGVRDEIVW